MAGIKMSMKTFFFDLFLLKILKPQLAKDNCKTQISLVALAFSASIGILLVVLSCALPTWGQQWWPMFVVTFYVLSPVPMLVGNRISNTDSLGAASSALRELCIFLTTGIVVSAYGLPLVFAHTQVIDWGPALLVLAGNTWCFVTILVFFIVFNRNDDFEFQVW